MGFFSSSRKSSSKQAETSATTDHPLATNADFSSTKKDPLLVEKEDSSDEEILVIDSPTSARQKQQNQEQESQLEGKMPAKESTTTEQDSNIAADAPDIENASNSLERTPSDEIEIVTKPGTENPAKSSMPPNQTSDSTSIVNEQFFKMKSMAEGGSQILRGVAFVGGLMVLFTSIHDWLWMRQILSSNEYVIHTLITIYASLLGVLICILDGDGFLPYRLDLLRRKIHANANLLQYVWGRGFLYIVTGSLQISQMTTGNILSGLFMVFFGGCSFIFGWITARKLTALRSSISDETILMDHFKKHDKDNDGYLSKSDFANLLKSVGLDLGEHHELDSAFVTVDVDEDQKISYTEFKSWWSEFKFDSAKNGLSV